MYVLAGFHKVLVSLKSLRPDLLLSDSDSEEDGDEDEEGERMLNSVEISNSVWCLDLKSWQWTKLEPGGEPPLKCDKAAAWSYRDKARPDLTISSVFSTSLSGISIRRVRTSANLQQVREGREEVRVLRGQHVSVVHQGLE